ncbi:MAG: riboflavin synthase [Actinomycetota bacterium]|nr:riboflavin synthase [Actinomycetota bacterium]
MFTGIVEELGEVVGLDRRADSARLTVRGPVVVSDATHGASIAVNGCCLTVVAHDEDSFRADVMAETLDKTSLGALRPGSPVNLERAVRADGRLGGHVVQGHVDGTGIVLERRAAEHWELVGVSVPDHLARFLVAKGSVTVDGISLTVVDVDDAAQGSSFTVSLIPETLAATTLGTATIGSVVNLEVDVLAKYVERLLATRTPTTQER